MMKLVTRLGVALICIYLLSTQAVAETDKVRLKDLGKFAGWRENALVEL